MLGCVAVVVSAGSALSASELATLTPVADGVWAATQPHDARFDDSNTLVVVGDRGVLVVDSQTSAEHTRAMIADIQRLTPRPVRWLVNTHWHDDHTRGNALYRDAFGTDLEIVGHVTLLEDTLRAGQELKERAAALEAEIPAAEDRLAQRVRRDGSPLTEEMVPLAEQGIAAAKELVATAASAVFLPPTLTYRQTLTLDLGGRTVEIHHRRAHTRGDSVVYLPGERILATGDLLDDLPFVGHGELTSWIETLEWIRGLDLAQVLPGHGPLWTAERAVDQAEAVSRFLETLLTVASEAAAGGATPPDAVRRLAEDPRFAEHRTALVREDGGAERFFDATLGDAIERALAEVRERDP